MTEQPQRIDIALGILMDRIPAAAREAVLALAKEIAEMSAEEREELERTYQHQRIKKYAPSRIVRKPEGAPKQTRKRGPKPVTAVA